MPVCYLRGNSVAISRSVAGSSYVLLVDYSILTGAGASDKTP